MKVSLSSGALAAFLCHGGLGTPLRGFVAFETNVISLRFCVCLSKIPARFGPTGQNPQDSNYDQRDNDDQNNHNR
jgi:hypothetical protein